MTTYFLKRAGKEEEGPYSATDLRRLADLGRINPRTDCIRANDSATWYLANTVKGLFRSVPSSQERATVPPAGDPVAHIPADPVDVYLPPPVCVLPEVTDDDFDIESICAVDEATIRQAVENRVCPVGLSEEWQTPSGNLRKVPLYIASISNEYLNTSRTIKGQVRDDVLRKAYEQIAKWKDQEIRARIAEANALQLAQTQERAANLSRQAKDLVQEIGGILIAGLNLRSSLDWNDYVDTREYPPFAFDPEPVVPAVREPRPSEPRKAIQHQILPFLWDRLLEKHQRDVSLWEERCRRQEQNVAKTHGLWMERRQAALVVYESEKADFLKEQAARNQAIARFRRLLAEHSPAAITRYVKEVLSRSPYPRTFDVSHAVSYDEASQTVVIDTTLPSLDTMTDVCDYKFVKSSGEITPVQLKPKDREALYDNAIKQTVIRTIHEVFSSIDTEDIKGVVINGWVTYLDRATGHEKSSCIVSVSTDRSQFARLNLHRVDPSECIKNLKGLVAGPMAQIAPVQPIMQLNREDSRFIESREVLADLNSRTNLAEIGWEEFEHLVRELFSKMFSLEGSEVRVTQASSDGGVDAVAFDPDPIRGGKFVIQAKRYTKAVPVSAVRDLYGTMIAEGAAKGILVTTASFGRDSREFVKDKPIALIDGSNLVYLLEQYGHKVRIDVQEARGKLDWDPLKR